MYLNSQAKGPLLDRTLERFLYENTEGAIPNLWESHCRVYLKSCFLFFWENLSGKKTEQESNIVIFLLCLFYLDKK